MTFTSLMDGSCSQVLGFTYTVRRCGYACCTELKRDSAGEEFYEFSARGENPFIQISTKDPTLMMSYVTGRDFPLLHQHHKGLFWKQRRQTWQQPAGSVLRVEPT